MTNFGTAYLQIVPSLKGGVKGLEDQINRSDIGGRTGKQAGNRFTSALGDMMKTAGGFVLAKAALAVGGAVGSAFTLGLDRYMSIENAEAKLSALGHSSETVATIMDNALASVKGTSFGLGEAADTAASMVASGIKPGEQLEEVLRTVANTAAIAGTDMDEMGSIFAKAAASGKVQGDILAQLADRGVPALQWLADELGVTTEEVTAMASAGEIDFETFQRAMANGMDPEAAVIMGETLSGSWANTKAALGRFGAEIMERIGPMVEKALNGIIAALDWLTEKAGPAFDWIVDKLGPAWDAVKGFFDGWAEGDALFADNDAITTGLADIKAGLESFWEVAEPILKDWLDRLKEWWSEHGPQVIRIMENMATNLGTAMSNIGRVITIAGKVIQWFWDLFGDDVMAEITSTLSFLAGMFEGASLVIGGIWEVLGGILTGDWEEVDKGLRKITEGLEIFFGAIFKRIHDMTIGRFQDMTGGMQTKVQEGADGVARKLTELRTRASEIATTIRNWVVDKFTGLADGVRNAARNAKNWFGEQFDEIKKKASTPVRFVIDTVYNDGIRKLWNNIANKFSLTALPYMSIPGFDGGGWTGPGPKLMPAGIVHADEFVIQKESRKRFEDRFPGFLSHINLHGDMPDFHEHGYASGGRVRPVSGGHSGWNGGRYRSGGWHGGVDYPMPMGSPVVSAAAGRVAAVNPWFHSYGHHVRVNHAGGWQTLYAHMSRLNAVVGQLVAAGQLIGRVGSTGNSTGPHLHFETLLGGRQLNPDGFLRGARGFSMSGSAQAGIDLPFFSSVRDLFGDPLKKLGQVSGSEWGKLIAAVPRGIADAVFDYAKDQLGFLDGGTVPHNGLHWLSEDGRPELVVGPQLGAMRANSRVFNGNETEGLIRGAARGAARDELANLLRNGVTLRDGKLWFDENMARHESDQVLAHGRSGGKL